MKSRIVALFKDEEGFYEDFKMTIDTTTDGDDIYHNFRQLEDLTNRGYLLDSCFITTNEELYLKKLLESALIKLKSTREVYKKHIEVLAEKLGEDDEVVKTTRGLQKSYEMSLMKVVGLRCARCLMRDIEVTDEIALQCCDLLNKNLV